MEIAKLIKMHKDLCIQMGKVADKVSNEPEYYMLRGKVELLEEFINKELNGLNDSIQYRDCICYKLFDTIGLQLECEFPYGSDLSFEQARRVAINRMEELNITEATIAIYKNGKLQLTKNLTLNE